MTENSERKHLGCTGRAPVAAIVGVLLIGIAAGAAWWFLWSPQTRVKKNVRAMCAALEARDADGIMAHFSENYNDNAGNTYETMDAAIRDFFLPLIEEVNVDIKSIRVAMEGDAAVAEVRGTVLYKIKGVPRRDKYDDDAPAILRFEREQGAWRVTSVENIGEDLSGMQESYDNVKDIL